jgi:hypothetical protein
VRRPLAIVSELGGLDVVLQITVEMMRLAISTVAQFTDNSKNIGLRPWNRVPQPAYRALALVPN